MTKARLQFDVSEEESAEYDGFVEECGTDTKKNLQAQMFTLWRWAVEESRKGRKIGSFEPDKANIEAVILPPLERIRKASQKRPDE